MKFKIGDIICSIDEFGEKGKIYKIINFIPKYGGVNSNAWEVNALNGGSMKAFNILYENHFKLCNSYIIQKRLGIK